MIIQQEEKSNSKTLSSIIRVEKTSKFLKAFHAPSKQGKPQLWLVFQAQVNQLLSS